jgi:hypothetical protein
MDQWTSRLHYNKTYEKCLKVTVEPTLNISQLKAFGHLMLTAMVASQKSHFKHLPFKTLLNL